MGLEFVKAYGGHRLDQYEPQPPLYDAPEDEEAGPTEGAPAVDLGYEVAPDDWAAIAPGLPPGWEPGGWPERPVRFVDGRDVGQTIAWIRSPEGYPIPIRLSEIGAVAVRVQDRECHREQYVSERVVSMVADVFPWDEVEGFASALQQHGLRLLLAQKPSEGSPYDFEVMRKAAQNRSNDEMGVFEEVVLADAIEVPTVVDGRLEPRAGAIGSAGGPIYGLVKTHRQNYLHARGLRLLYDLGVGERTPAFALPATKLPVVSWYVRLTGGNGATPNYGLVRVEVPKAWFESTGKDYGIVDQLSRTLVEYRSRDGGYGRVAVSLHPIVRAEQLLGATFAPIGALTSHFYRMTSL
jgi:hypothetical protein